MQNSPPLRTLDEIREWFLEQGQAVSSWAQEHGYKTQQVYAVISGRAQGRRGVSHEIAVELGLKAPPRAEATLGRNVLETDR